MFIRKKKFKEMAELIDSQSSYIKLLEKKLTTSEKTINKLNTEITAKQTRLEYLNEEVIFQYKTSNEEYEKIIENVRSGRWKPANEQDIQQAKKELNEKETAYERLNAFVDCEERQTGICQDNYANMFYDVYGKPLEEEKEAIRYGFTYNSVSLSLILLTIDQFKECSSLSQVYEEC